MARLFRYIFKLVLLISPAIVYGIDIPSGLINQIDPGRTAEDLAPQYQPPELEPQQNVIIKKSRVEPAVESTSQVKFMLHKIIFEGNTTFTDQQLSAVCAEWLNKEVSFTDLENIAQKITSLYNQHGYILVKVIIPPQTINTKGELIINIIEGYISKVTIEGNVSNSVKRLINLYSKKIVASKPLNYPVLERYVLLANDIPGVTAKTILTKADIYGSSELHFIVNEKSTGWYVNANNLNAEVLGRNQVIGGLYKNGLLMGSHTSVNMLVSIESNRLFYTAVQHQQIIDGHGLGYNVLLSGTKSNPKFKNINITQLETPGTALLAILNAKYPWIRSRNKNLTFELGINILNSKANIQNFDLFNDHVRYLAFNTYYSFVDFLYSNNNLNFSVNQGLNLLHAYADPASRLGGELTFTLLTAEYTRAQPITNRWTTLIGCTGQYSFDQLLSSQKFGFGGEPYGYGYDPSVISGDQGLALRAELQYARSYAFKFQNQIQYFTFFNYGKIWNRNQIIDPDMQSATSAGVGIRSVFFRKIKLELVYAKPFNTYITNNNKNSWRLLFNLFYTDSK